MGLFRPVAGQLYFLWHSLVQRWLSKHRAKQMAKQAACLHVLTHEQKDMLRHLRRNILHYIKSRHTEQQYWPFRNPGRLLLWSSLVMSQLSEHHTRNWVATSLPCLLMSCTSGVLPPTTSSALQIGSAASLALPSAIACSYTHRVRVLRQTWTPECNRTCGDLITATAHLFWSEPTYTTFTTTYTCTDVKHATIFAKTSLKLYTFKHNYSILKLQKKFFHT
jgi:hypothetical protein